MLSLRTSVQSNEMSQLFWRFASGLREAASESLRYSRKNLVAIGAVGCVSFPVYYLVWLEIFPQDYENLTLRVIGSLLCLPLMLVRYWPAALERYLTFYFWVVAVYCLPFFFQFMLLQNAQHSYTTQGSLSLMWQMSNVVALFLLVMLINDGALIGLTFLVGTICAWALFAATNDQIVFEAVQSGYLAPMPVYLFILIGGSVYNHHREAVQQEMLRAVSSVGSNIAHELRTPLLGIKSDARGVARYLPELIEGYTLAADAGLPVKRIRHAHLVGLHDVVQRIDNETDYANTIIDMLLINSGGTRVVPSEFRNHSVRDCVTRALQRYPFSSDAERASVHFAEGPDFKFRGSDILLMHVLFNLLKNSLYYVAHAGKGEIFIWVEANPVGENRLFFMDTGQGIHPGLLPRIFDRFFTSMETGRGSGIGLSFCRMVMEGFDGRIACESIQGEFTRFIMSFPGVDDDE
ncbi:MAG TPA: HAMP domain-containing sensor histidine kinase [Pseudomonadales bacterium]|nr:HAMP domain-containing sensor histidine kinase [Pseudomonadales bacterium]